LTQGVGATLYLPGGPGIGVVATEDLTGQVAPLYPLGLELGLRRGSLSAAEAAEYLAALQVMPDLIASALERPEQAQRIAAACVNVDRLLFIGRGVGYPAALEGALKLKEISYIHAEGYPAGELKQGPIALVEPGMLMLALATAGRTYDKVVANVQEVKARQARVVAIATEGDRDIAGHADEVIHVPSVPELMSPMVSVIPMQLLAYYA